MIQEPRLIDGGRIRSHSIHIDDRRLMSVSGVKDVDSFNEQMVVLSTSAGTLTLLGDGLHVSDLNLENGRLLVDGEIAALEYDERGHSQRTSWFSRLFR